MTLVPAVTFFLFRKLLKDCSASRWTQHPPIIYILPLIAVFMHCKLTENTRGFSHFLFSFQWVLFEHFKILSTLTLNVSFHNFRFFLFLRHRWIFFKPIADLLFLFFLLPTWKYTYWVPTRTDKVAGSVDYIDLNTWLALTLATQKDERISRLRRKTTSGHNDRRNSAKQIAHRFILLPIRTIP